MRVHPNLFPESEFTTSPFRLALYDLLHAWKWLVFINSRYYDQKSKQELDFKDRASVNKYLDGVRGKGKSTAPDYIGGKKDGSGVTSAPGPSELGIDISDGEPNPQVSSFSHRA